MALPQLGHHIGVAAAYQGKKFPLPNLGVESVESQRFRETELATCLASPMRRRGEDHKECTAADAAQ
jgi:hypothetical protein